MRFKFPKSGVWLIAFATAVVGGVFLFARWAEQRAFNTPRVLTGKNLKFANGSYFDTLALSPDGETLAAATQNPATPAIFLWDVASGKQLNELAVSEYSYSPYYFAFAPDSSTIAITDYEGDSVNLHTAISGDWKTVRTTDFPAKKSANDPLKQATFGYHPSALAFSPDGQTLAVATMESTSSISLWDVKTGAFKQRLPSIMTDVFALAFSPDGETLAAGATTKSGSSRVFLWNWQIGQQKPQLKGAQDRIHSLAFSPDGSFIVGGDEGGHATLWNTSNGKIVRTFRDNLNGLLAVSFSPDGKTIACAGSVTHLWDVQSGKVLRVLQGGTAAVFLGKGDNLACINGSEILIWRLK